MNYKEILHDFKSWMTRRNYRVDSFTSEFTIQHRMAVFLDGYLHRKYDCELEVNVEKYNLGNLTKKEIDIVVSSADERHAIELKFIKDQGSFNIGMYKVCEDVRFLEQLKNNGFASVCAYTFTNIPKVYTSTIAIPTPKNFQNLELYVQFRNDKKIHDTIAIKTGQLNEFITLSRSHSFQWIDFIDGVKATWISE